jgi:hypothetical protein
MALLRILTGILTPKRTPGAAIIEFNPHQVSGDAEGIELKAAGARGDFEQPPGKVVSLRQLEVVDRTRFLSSKDNKELFQIDDYEPTQKQMVVRWNATKGAEIHEISYLVVGEA